MPYYLLFIAVIEAQNKSASYFKKKQYFLRLSQKTSLLNPTLFPEKKKISAGLFCKFFVEVPW